MEAVVEARDGISHSSACSVLQRTAAGTNIAWQSTKHLAYRRRTPHLVRAAVVMLELRAAQMTTVVVLVMDWYAAVVMVLATKPEKRDTAQMAAAKNEDCAAVAMVLVTALERQDAALMAAANNEMTLFSSKVVSLVALSWV